MKVQASPFAVEALSFTEGAQSSGGRGPGFAGVRLRVDGAGWSEADEAGSSDEAGLLKKLEMLENVLNPDS
jgi:hypothetical protein